MSARDGAPPPPSVRSVRRAFDRAATGYDAAAVLDLVGEVSFSNEPRDEIRVGRAMRVEHLHRGALAVAMRRGVDSGTAPVPEERVERPFAVEQSPDSGLRQLPRRR